jgi:hypothetical protein
MDLHIIYKNMVNILLEDIRNYTNIKQKLQDIHNNKSIELKEDIQYFINDYCPFIYGISKISYKRLRRIKAFCVKEKKYIYLLSLIINNNDNCNSQINRYIGCLTIEERDMLMLYLHTKYNNQVNKNNGL